MKRSPIGSLSASAKDIFKRFYKLVKRTIRKNFGSLPGHEDPRAYPYGKITLFKRAIIVAKHLGIRIIRDKDLIPKVANYACACVSLLIILLSFLKPWYAIPWIDFEAQELDIFTTDSYISRLFKLVLLSFWLLFILAFPFFLWRGKRAGQVLIHYTVTALFVTLIYPTFLVLFDSPTSGDGAWLQQQHDTMTWLGGDVFRAHSERSIESGTGVNAQDPPDRLAVFKPPTGGLGLSRLNDWLWWFGYGPQWTQFAGKGWFFAVIGYGLFFITLIGHYWRLDVKAARYFIKQVIKQAILFSSIILFTVVSLYTHTRNTFKKAENATAEGDYKTSYEYLIKASRLVPTVLNDSSIIKQIGYTQWKLGLKELPESMIYQVHWLDAHGYHDRAGALMDLMYRKAHDLPRHVQRELSRQQLRVAINDINSVKNTAALQHLARLLAREPNCLQAYFHQQLATIQTDDYLKSRKAHEHLVTLYKGFKSKNKRGVESTSYWLLSQSELKAGNNLEAWNARRRSKGVKGAE